MSPVVLVECDWDNVGLDNYFGFPVTPGLAEWLRGECTEEDMRHKINDNLTIIRAGDGKQDAVTLLQQIMKRGLRKTLAHNDENLLIDLPPVITCSYSVFAASIVDALALVVRAGVTPDNLVADACLSLDNLPVQGLILNQVGYRPESYSTARKKI
jgi:Mrp family chromosome partitioning ATPase